jgi:hypothetical protein
MNLKNFLKQLKDKSYDTDQNNTQREVLQENSLLPDIIVDEKKQYK